MFFLISSPWEKAVNVSPLSMMLAVGFCYFLFLRVFWVWIDTFIRLRKFFSFSNLIRVFVSLFKSRGCFESIEKILWFSFFLC